MNRTTKFISMLLVGLSTLITACGPKEKSQQVQLDEKKEEISDVSIQISELEMELRNLKSEYREMGGSLEEPPDTIYVTTMAVNKGDFEEFVHVAGQVSSKNNVNVSSDMGGIVKRVYVTEGQRVSAGQLLAKIDDAVMQNSVMELETQLKLANTVWEKRKVLWEEQQIGSEVEYLQSKTNVESLEASLATANSQLAKTEVRSPISGTVDLVFLNSGEMAGPGTPIARVINLNRVQIKAQLSEIYLGRINVGDEVEITFNSLNDTIHSKVSAIGEVIDPANRTFTVEFNLTNSGGILKPNMMADLKLRTRLIPNQIMVPTRLIQQSWSGNFIYAVDGGIVERRDIVSGRSSEGVTVIKSGLSGNELLVNSGYRNVSDGVVAIESEL